MSNRKNSVILEQIRQTKEDVKLAKETAKYARKGVHALARMHERERKQDARTLVAANKNLDKYEAKLAKLREKLNA